MGRFRENFREGDVIYGTWKARLPYITDLPEPFRQACESNGNYLICDDYNNRSWLPNRRPGTNPPNSPKAIDGNVNAFADSLEPNNRQKEAIHAFFDKLCSSGRSPKKALSADPGILASAGKGLVMDLQIRRACKYGLEYILLTKKKQVHFVLDSSKGDGRCVDFRPIVQKQMFEDFVPITSSELRCCYRNRRKWMATGRLKFYVNRVEVQAPWIFNPEAWKEYEAHRAEKHPVKAFFHRL